jgi:cellulose synthase/poly-beta-1,6-N-acetylglucosamine synthase-like glycosyltransferase
MPSALLRREAGLRGAALHGILRGMVIPQDFTLSVVVPVYNEERTLAKLVDAVRAVPRLHCILKYR